MTYGDVNSKGRDPAQEAARLAALERYQILDTAPEPAFDAITRMAAQIGAAPMALISLVDAHRQWFKSRVGVEAQEMSLDAGLCPIAVHETADRDQQPLVVPDVQTDLRFAAHPAMAAVPYVRFYAGFPLITPQGQVLGTLCVMDRAPKQLSEAQVQTLHALAGETMIQLELRRENLALKPDAAEPRRVERALRDSEAQLRLITDSVPTLIAYVDTRRHYRFSNKAYQEWRGRRSEQIVGKHLREVIGEAAYDRVTPHVERALAGHRVSFEMQVPYDLGPARHISATYIPDHDERGEVRGYISLINDVTDRKRTEERLSHLANYDTLTNLPNRVLFMDRLHQALAQAPRHGRPVAVLFLDLDRFKNINDSLGHHVGDLLLKEVAQRLTGCVRESDTVARLSGDEFVVMLAEIARPADAALLAQKLVLTIHQPFEIVGQTLTVDASVGVALYPRDAADAGTLLKNADTAMYRAKERGRNQYREYSKAMGARAARRLTLENDLRRALSNDEFELKYQPQIDLSRRRVVAAEVYLRWRRPGWDRLVRPSDFLDEAEARGLAVPISEWVLRAACKQHRLWREQGCALPRVTVHLSAPQVRQSNLVKTVSRILRQTQCVASALEVQLSENLLHAPEVERVVRSLRQRGVRIAVGNIGHSPLSYLKRLSVDNLKIDRAFMRDMPGDPNKAAAVAAIIATARALQVMVTAEGVETEEQLELLRTLGCDAAQGFLLGKPMAASELTKRLAIEGRE